jgi:hypothetical protein
MEDKDLKTTATADTVERHTVHAKRITKGHICSQGKVRNTDDEKDSFCLVCNAVAL